jgi:hypothetical protein
VAVLIGVGLREASRFLRCPACARAKGHGLARTRCKVLHGPVKP